MRETLGIEQDYQQISPANQQLKPWREYRPTLKVGLHPSWWQVFLTTAGMIAAINSVLVGVFVGLLLSALFSFPLLVCTSTGVLTFLVSLGIYQRYQWGQWRRLEQDLAALVLRQENGVERA